MPQQLGLGLGSSRTTTFTRACCGLQPGSRKPPSLLRSMATRKSSLVFSTSSPALRPAFSLPDIQTLVFSFETWFAKKISPCKKVTLSGVSGRRGLLCR